MREGTGLPSRTPDPLRLLFLAVILLAHAVAIYFLSSGTNAPGIVRGDEFPALPIYITPMLEPQQQESRSPRAKLAPMKREESPASTAIVTPVPPPEGPVAPAADSRPDWESAATEAAERLARSEAEGDRKYMEETRRDGLPSDKAPPGVFDRDSHHAGDVQVLGPGIERRWISARCYREFGLPPGLLADSRFNVLPITCLGPQPPDSDLFDHLKPGYLERKD